MKKSLLFLFAFSSILVQAVQAQYFVNIQAIEPDFQVSINEILPNPEGTDTGKEWIELYNYSKETINLQNWQLKDTSTKSFVFEEIELDSHEFLLIYPNFSLNQSDENVSLYDDLGNLVDSFSYIISSEGLSWARIPDGVGNWIPDKSPTPGSTNNIDELDYPDSLLISEIYPTPKDQESEWLEIFNNSSDEIDLTNWIISDLSNSAKLPGIIIEPYEYLTFEENLLTSVTLNNSGDTLALLNPNAEPVHEFIYQKTNAGLSNILYKESILQTKLPTPGEENIYVNPQDCFFGSIYTDIKSFKMTEASSDDIFYSLTGTVIAKPGTIYDSKFYIQDSDSGLMVSLPAGYNETIEVGEQIEICGSHNAYYSEDEFVTASNGLRKLGSSTNTKIFETEHALPDLVGNLIKISGEIVENSSTSITVLTKEEQIKVKLSHLILTEEKSKGDNTEITGVLTRYGDTKDGQPNLRLVPRSTDDIKFVRMSKPSTTSSSKMVKSSAKISTNQIKGVTSTKTSSPKLSKPQFHDRLDSTDLSLGIGKKSQQQHQTTLRAISASGFLFSSSSIFLLFGKKTLKSYSI
ncbi:lamin tail domain-containing protein [Candidatus Dojkabacteria bacterium]|nr:lamin tail domain-containing protein [Candidatus Dojkabacteria bacterium]